MPDFWDKRVTGIVVLKVFFKLSLFQPPTVIEDYRRFISRFKVLIREFFQYKFLSSSWDRQNFEIKLRFS